MTKFLDLKEILEPKISWNYMNFGSKKIMCLAKTILGPKKIWGFKKMMGLKIIS